MQDLYYLVDSDVLITAKNRYYAFDICPRFWKSLLDCHQEKRVFSITRVRGELLRGKQDDELVHWVKSKVPTGFFLEEGIPEVVDAYGKIMVWLESHSHYSDPARAEFSRSADAWLVAFAHVHNAIIVTNERSAPNSKKNVKLPDVCQEFNVKQEDTFAMLRSLGVRFD